MTDHDHGRPCPLCGYLAGSVLDALVHLGGHIRGREYYQTGLDQQRESDSS